MQRHSLQIFPSIIAADFGHLTKEVQRVEKAGADGLHVDLMDGHFVPNITLGPKALAAMNRASPLFMDVHLMMYNPFDFVETLVKSGADRITFHIEATEGVEDVIDYVKKSGVQVGIACSPETSPSLVMPFISKVDLVLVMSVHPGFGGQEFLTDSTQKIEDFRQEIDARGSGTLLAVDGGITLDTGKACVAAGADLLIAGSYLFNAKEMEAAITAFKDLSSV